MSSATRLLSVVLSICTSVVVGAQPAHVPSAASHNCESGSRSSDTPVEAPRHVSAAKPDEHQANTPEERACGGCPARRPGRAFLQMTSINIGYGVANLVRGQVTARVTPTSWWRNLRRGEEWDLDRFLVNQLGHPCPGSHHFSAGRPSEPGS